MSTYQTGTIESRDTVNDDVSTNDNYMPPMTSLQQHHQQQQIPLPLNGAGTQPYDHLMPRHNTQVLTRRDYGNLYMSSQQPQQQLQQQPQQQQQQRGEMYI